MRNFFLLTLFAGAFISSLPASAQEKSSPEMARLSRLMLGTWDAKLRSGNSTVDEPGRQSVELGPAGNSLIQNYRGGTKEAPVIGHGILWWDATDGVYRALWCDSDLPSGCRNPSAGNFSGNDLIFSQQREVKGHRVSSRGVYTDIKPDSFTFFLELQKDDGPAQRILTVRYSRARIR